LSSKIDPADPVRVGDNEIFLDGYLGKFDVTRLVMTDFIKKNKSVSEG